MEIKKSLKGYFQKVHEKIYREVFSVLTWNYLCVVYD